MPIHLDALDVVPELEGTRSTLIVACNMCAGASLAMKEEKPFIELFSSLLKSPPLERHIRRLQRDLEENGVRSATFRGGIIQQFFLCLWTARQRAKLRKQAGETDAVIVMGCDSAMETARESVRGTKCKVIKGMEVAGIMNTKATFHLPFNISFEDARTIPMCDGHCGRRAKAVPQRDTA